MSEETFDAFLALEKTEITGLLDGGCKVELVDVFPRIISKSYTPEYMVVRAARCSYGLGLKDPVSDAKLLNYLFRNHHTSPFEMAGITFRLVVPKFVSIQLLRHRHSRINEFSQRYAEVPEGNTFYDPLQYSQGIRLQSKTNKQGSIVSDIGDETIQVAKSEIASLMTKANSHLEELHSLYHQMIDKGCAKEVARCYLPMSEYTTLYYQLDLNNLVKFLTLRADFDHAQYETAVVAQAMWELVKPLFPATLEAMQDRNNGLCLSGKEVQLLSQGGGEELEGSEGKSFRDKKERLGL